MSRPDERGVRRYKLAFLPNLQLSSRTALSPLLWLEEGIEGAQAMHQTAEMEVEENSSHYALTHDDF